MSGMLACSPGVCLEKPRGARIFKEQRSHSYGNRRAFIIIFFLLGTLPTLFMYFGLFCAEECGAKRSVGTWGNVEGATQL